jgi:hypothetical protein
MEKYPDEILCLLTDKGFDKKFETCISTFSTHEEAYEAVEAVVYHWFKIRNYASYNSYRGCRNLRLKKKIGTDKKKAKRI